MLLPRFRIRTLMIAVAVVGLVAWGGIEVRRLGRLSSDYRRRASSAALVRSALLKIHTAAEKLAPVVQETLESTKRYDPDEVPAIEQRLAGIISDRDKSAVEIDYWSNLQTKYEHAARYPWLPLEPDPPAPKDALIPVNLK